MSGNVREWTPSLWGDYPYPKIDSIAEGEGAIAVSKDGIYAHGNVVGDVLGAWARKVTITEETTSRCMDCQTRTCFDLREVKSILIFHADADDTEQ